MQSRPTQTVAAVSVLTDKPLLFQSLRVTTTRECGCGNSLVSSVHVCVSVLFVCSDESPDPETSFWYAGTCTSSEYLGQVRMSVWFAIKIKNQIVYISDNNVHIKA